MTRLRVRARTPDSCRQHRLTCAATRCAAPCAARIGSDATDGTGNVTSEAEAAVYGAATKPTTRLHCKASGDTTRAPCAATNRVCLRWYVVWGTSCARAATWAGFRRI